MGAVKRAVNRGIKAVKNPLKTVKDVVKNPLKEVRETADIVGDFVSETVDITNKGVKALTGTDLIENVSNMTEEAWENDAVKAAAVVATGAYLAGVGPFAAAGTAGTASTAATTTAIPFGGVGGYGAGAGVGAATATTATSAGIGATLSSVGSSLLAGAADLGKTVVTEVGRGVATAYTTQALTGGGGGEGGGFASPSVRLSRGADSVYSEFRARQVNFGIDPRVAQAMQRIAQSNQEELVAFREDATRVASGGVTLNLGSVTTGGVGVRSTTGVS